MNDWILLDVSGVLFKTTRATLTSDPDCVLTKMFEQNPRFQPPPLTVYGFYQIDACPAGLLLSSTGSGTDISSLAERSKPWT